MKLTKNQKQRNPRYFLKEGWFGFGDDEPETPAEMNLGREENAFEKLKAQRAEEKARDKAAIDSARQEYHKLKSRIDRSFDGDDPYPDPDRIEDLRKLATRDLRQVYGDEAEELRDEIYKTSQFYSDKLYDLKRKRKARLEKERASQYRPEPEYDVLVDPITDRYETRRGGPPPAGGQLYVRREGITKSRLKQIIREEIKRLQK